MATVPTTEIQRGMRILSVDGYTPPDGVLPATVVALAGTTTVMDYLEYVYDLDNGRKLYLDPGRSRSVVVDDSTPLDGAPLIDGQAPSVGDRIEQVGTGRRGTVTHVDVQRNALRWQPDVGVESEGNIVNPNDPNWWVLLTVDDSTPLDGAPLIDDQAPTTTDTPHEATPCPSCGVECGNHPAAGCPPHGDLTVYPRGSVDARLDANTGASLDSEDPARIPAWWWSTQDAPRNPMPALRFAPPTMPPIVVVEGEELDSLRFRVGAYDLATVRTVRVAVSDNGLMVDMGNGWWAPIGRPANERGW